MRIHAPHALSIFGDKFGKVLLRQMARLDYVLALGNRFVEPRRRVAARLVPDHHDRRISLRHRRRTSHSDLPSSIGQPNRQMGRRSRHVRHRGRVATFRPGRKSSAKTRALGRNGSQSDRGARPSTLGAEHRTPIVCLFLEVCIDR